MGKMDTNQKPIPSAPPSEAPPYPQVPRENQLPLQGAATGQGSNSDPPPYQETFNYPQVPPYPVYAPTTTMPVQPSMPVQPPPQYVYPPAQAPQVIYTINQQAPPPPPPPPPPPVSRSTNVTVVTSNATGVIRGGDPCPSCLGSYVNQVDSCCLVCLIILTICTFPFGLILIPFYFCTCRKRCNVCGRLK